MKKEREEAAAMAKKMVVISCKRDCDRVDYRVVESIRVSDGCCNEKGCRVMSVSLLLAAYTAVYAVNRLAYGQMILLGLLLCAVLTLWLLAPIGTENKPLDDIEHRIYQKRTRIIVLVETILAVFTLYEGISVIYLPIVMAFLISSALLVMGCIKLRKNKGK